MSIQPTTNDHFPADFQQLYALGYAELCVYIESFLDGNLTQAELSDHYRHQLNKHTNRINDLAKEVANRYDALRAAARQE